MSANCPMVVLRHSKCLVSAGADGAAFPGSSTVFLHPVRCAGSAFVSFKLRWFASSAYTSMVYMVYHDDGRGRLLPFQPEPELPVHRVEERDALGAGGRERVRRGPLDVEIPRTCQSGPVQHRDAAD